MMSDAQAAPEATIMPPAPEMSATPAVPAPTWETLPDGEYAIVELFGHTTLVGRIAEVERFGAKMMALEPLFNGTLLEPIYHGGAAIYRLTPCSRKIAWEKQPRQAWQLPPSIKCVVPIAALPSPEAVPSLPSDDDYSPSDTIDDDQPF